MKTLLSSPPPPLFYLSRPPPPSWKPRSPTILHTETLQNLDHSSRTRKIQANAKGFANSTPNAVTESARDKNSSKKSKNEDDDEVPQEVFERIIVRILFSVGVPLGIGFAFLHFFGVAKEQNLFDVPLWLPFLTTIVTFGASTLGIAYGALSTSWDKQKTGSFLGLEEAQQNWTEMWKEENDEQW